ncbi:PP2C family protein-serine/threonine phosphatase [Streptomyces qinzhouensis]|uniref:PP2C family protein-serine/threonine phosphatase n=1 Tax=Streptomyces qinzhouensis TaxID=2599401 RepID=UPI001FE7D1F9|nr:PP2C family protein-serine/threonine phosphatase [Streptomyces qinzhouensis]
MVEGACTDPGAPVAFGERVADRVADLTTLHELTGRLTAVASLDAALDEVLRAGAGIVGARRGLIVLEPPPGTTALTSPVSVTRGYGLSHAELGHIETVPRPLTAYGRILEGTESTEGAEGIDAPARRAVRTEPAGPAPEHGTPDGSAPGSWPYPPPCPRSPAVAHPDILNDDSLDPLRREVAVRLGCAAAYTQPLMSRTAGTLGAAVWLYDTPTVPTDRHRRLVDDYMRYAAEHLARLAELAEARRAVASIADELLPSRLPHVPGVRLAARHRTGPHGPRGNWYDALPLPEGALGLAVGSVGGTGPRALAAVGRLRASLRAYAVMEGEDPVAVLSDLELLLRLTEPAGTATALFAYAEPAAGKMVLAGAGHTPPLLIGERRTEFVETSLSAPLGMLACWEAPSVELCPEPGETVLLYTDGLLRRTGEPMDRAFTRLHAAAASVPRAAREDPGAVADHVLHTLFPRAPEPAGWPEEDTPVAPALPGGGPDGEVPGYEYGARPAPRDGFRPGAPRSAAYGDGEDDIVLLAVRFG